MGLASTVKIQLGLHGTTHWRPERVTSSVLFVLDSLVNSLMLILDMLPSIRRHTTRSTGLRYVFAVFTRKRYLAAVDYNSNVIFIFATLELFAFSSISTTISGSVVTAVVCQVF